MNLQDAFFISMSFSLNFTPYFFLQVYDGEYKSKVEAFDMEDAFGSK
jgi:hypothetical protein